MKKAMMQESWSRVVVAGLMLFLVMMPAQAGARRVTISFLARGNPTYIDLLQRMIDFFEEANPNVRVQMQPEAGDFNSKLATLIASGLAPDVAFIDANSFRPFAASGALMNLSDMVAKDRSFDERAYLPWALDSLRYKGDLYALPYDGGPYALYYNQNLFDQYGVGYPTNRWTVLDLQTAAKKLTRVEDGQTTQFGVDLNGWSFWLWVWAFGGEVLSADERECLLGEKNARDGLQWMADIMNVDRSMYNYAYSVPVNVGFEHQTVAMVTYGYWFVSNYRRLDFDWDVAPIPAGRQRAGLGWYSGFAIPQGARRPQEAWEFVKWLVSEEGNRAIAPLGVALPAMVKVAKSNDFMRIQPPKNNMAWVEFADDVRIPPYHEKFEEMQNQIMYPELNKVWTGTQSVGQAVDSIVPRVNKLLETLK